ncbi:carbon-nitrogen hydrolase family protein [Dongia sp.]|uniref:carbon-nitrogen hydrolase family protein n=1 Tax=Dongia sp. TaxID=1977262 RepID=UPI0035B471E5
MRLALLQNDSVPLDTGWQFATLAEVARHLSGTADLLVTPELFMTGYRIDAADIRRLAEPADGPFARKVARLAQETHVAILYGFPERDGDRLYNSVQVFDALGRQLALYRKLHLPSDEERAVFTAGDRLVTFDLGGFKVAPLICYDVEFPESVRACALSGADLVIAPTALRRHWARIAEMMIPVRALENGVFLAYANQAGSEADWDYAGLSCIIAPDGKELVRASDQPAVILAELDRAEIGNARAKLAYLRDARFSLTGPA